jgi:hypothetical protein
MSCGASATLKDVQLELGKIPSLKLPPKRLRGCLEAVAAAGGRRDLAVSKVLATFPDRFDEKSAFRALVAPTLTRLHFARSDPPSFYLAPNGQLWNRLIPGDIKEAFIGLVIHDFAEYRLGLPASVLSKMCNPTIFREEAQVTILDKDLVARAMRFSRFLNAFMPPDVYTLQSRRLSLLGTSSTNGAVPTRSTNKVWGLLAALVPAKRMVSMDAVRFGLMEKLWKEQVLSSSFRIDWILQKLLISHESGYVSIPGPYARLDSLMVRNIPCSAVMRISEGGPHGRD